MSLLRDWDHHDWCICHLPWNAIAALVIEQIGLAIVEAVVIARVDRPAIRVVIPVTAVVDHRTDYRAGKATDTCTDHRAEQAIAIRNAIAGKAAGNRTDQAADQAAIAASAIFLFVVIGIVRLSVERAALRQPLGPLCRAIGKPWRRRLDRVMPAAMMTPVPMRGAAGFNRAITIYRLHHFATFVSVVVILIRRNIGIRCLICRRAFCAP